MLLSLPLPDGFPVLLGHPAFPLVFAIAFTLSFKLNIHSLFDIIRIFLMTEHAPSLHFFQKFRHKMP